MSRFKFLMAGVLSLLVLAGVCGANPFTGRGVLRTDGLMHTMALPAHYVLERTIGVIPPWHPMDLCVDGDGYTYFIDGQHSTICKLPLTGSTLVRKWGGVGSGGGKFRQPRSIGVDALGYVYVLDTTLSSVQRFTRQGLFVQEWQVSSDTKALATGPSGKIFCLAPAKVTTYSPTGKVLATFAHSGGKGTDIGVDSSGNSYILDQEPAIYKYNSSGGFTSKIVSGAENSDYLVNGVIAVGGTTLLVGNESNAGALHVWSTAGILRGHYVPFGGAKGQAADCHGVALDAAGNLYISDLDEARIQKLNPTGGYMYKWGWGSTASGQFRGPSGVAVDSSGNIYVTDAFNQRVQEFSAAGAFLRYIGNGAGTGNGQFQLPLGIALSGGKVLVSDILGNRVQRFTSLGVYDNLQWGVVGTGNSQFEGPLGLAVASTGNIYVADQGNRRIQYFNASGGYLGQFGATELQSPWGIAISGSKVYVTDDLLNKVVGYSLTGATPKSWGTSGSLYGQFTSPRQMCTDAAGKLWIADFQLGWIQQFTTAGSVQNAVQMADAAHPWTGNIMACASGPGGRLYMTDLAYQQVYVFAPATPSAAPRPVVINSLNVAPTTNGGASIQITLSAPADVTVEITNIAGRHVATLRPRDLPEGITTLLWNGVSDKGTKVPSGRYLAQVQASADEGTKVQRQAVVERR